MFDSNGAFTIQMPNVAHQCPALLYAMFALSARQIERKNPKHGSFDSLELYQQAIQLLGPLLRDRKLELIPTCVILCVLEMMSASPRNWRRHLEGCAALFDAFGVNGFSGGVLQSTFWCYARMDLCGALISDGLQATLVALERWLPNDTRLDEAAEAFRSCSSPDMHANYAVFLCAKVCSLIADRTQFVELGVENGCDDDMYGQRWSSTWHELQRWVQDRPAEIRPVHSVPSEPFPHTLFAHWAAVSSNQLYHTACILLLGSQPAGSAVMGGRVGSAIWHAKAVCGISLTNPHAGCLNNAIQPLWIAGRLLSHLSEHVLLAELIRSIESTTGWATTWRIADLEVQWGHKVASSDT